MSRLPSSCYRLQLRQGVDFCAARRLLPYLERLGISHLYLSPIFAAQSGSTHGYDVIDPTRVDDVLGGREGFDRLAAAARQKGMGIILDIVPNHMAFSLENEWLRDLLRSGVESRFYPYFDVFPDPRLALPMLEAPFEECLADGAMSISVDQDGPVLVCGPLRVPLDPQTLRDADEGALDCASLDRDAIRTLHARQFWRLCYWRTERDAISHRRFFNVTGLIGVRVEESSVFEETHRLIFDLVDSGSVSGLRIDHVDGLADPGQYLQRLRDRLPEVPVWVEKILATGETLPDWPVEGTTGYVVARDIGQILTNSEGVLQIGRLYRQSTGDAADFDKVVRDAKREILRTDLAAELWRLQELVAARAASDPVASEYGPESWREAIIGLIACLPRYRTYFNGGDAQNEDLAALTTAMNLARGKSSDPRPLAFLLACITETGAKEVRVRFQQLAGATMAKGQEDTAFYRDTRLICTNEVGSDPAMPAIPVETFHTRMQVRARTMPAALSLTSSHDTKRTEDARMRVAALSHHPDTARTLLEAARRMPGAASVPAELRWYLMQSLWALSPCVTDRVELEDRLCSHALKAMRETNEGTNWRDPQPEFEGHVLDFTKRIVCEFFDDFRKTSPAADTAMRLSLAQMVLKMTLPGIPDIYQGCEVGNYALTDPDNRRPVDFLALEEKLAGHAPADVALDRLKMCFTRKILHFRRDSPDIFLHGGYTAGSHAPGMLCFHRNYRGENLRVVVSCGAPLPLSAQTPDTTETMIWPDDLVKGIAIAIQTAAVFHTEARGPTCIEQ